MKREPFFIFIIGMSMGYISQMCFDKISIALGVLGYLLTIMIVVGMVFNDKE